MNISIQQGIIQTLHDGSWLTFFIVFWGGALLSLSSCTIIRTPVVIGYVGGMANSRKRAFLLTSFFVLGLVLSYTSLGVFFGLISGFIGNMIRWSRYLYYLIGVLAFFVGIQMLGLIDVGLFKKDRIKSLEPKRKGLLGAFLFGFVFAAFEAPICPCCGPVLFIIAGHTIAKGRVLYAVAVFLVYALGQSLPILLIGGFTGIIKYISSRFEKIENIAKPIGGNILIILALYFFLVG